MVERGGTPRSIGDAIRSFLRGGELGARVEQAEVVQEWPRIVGEQIANVTDARGVSGDGSLIVYVRTPAWMTELSLREPEIVAAIRNRLPGSPVTRIRWYRWH